MSAEKKTIGLVLPYLKSRGTEKQALRLARGFVERGWRVVVFVVQGWGLENMYQAFCDAGVVVVNVGKPNGVGQKKIKLSRIFPLASLARKYKCAVLLGRAFRSNRVCGWAGLIAFIPTVLVLSNAVILNKRLNKGGYRRKIYLIYYFIKSFGMPRYIVAISMDSAHNFSLLYPFYSKRVKTIYNGVDVSAEGYDGKGDLYLDRGKFNICFSGSLYLHRKGLDLLIESVRRLIFELGLNCARLILIGTGKDELKIRDLVRINGLDGYVVFAGEQINPYPIIKQCDVFVFPSRREGFGNSLIEAMALGICCISADCDFGPREAIENDKNGILFPVNDKRALTEAIMRVYKNNPLRKELAQNGLKTAEEKFSYRRMIDSYYDLIMSIA